MDTVKVVMEVEVHKNNALMVITCLRRDWPGASVSVEELVIDNVKYKPFVLKG